jgi:hypothetical protein
MRITKPVNKMKAVKKFATEMIKEAVRNAQRQEKRDKEQVIVPNHIVLAVHNIEKFDFLK